ncbi:hypothetical protein MLD38_012728 [Melastoma candidum]|uniref:Uncharacterized protein n=1 Tax=Melastoma candidum TaxID=119954 RepID=A0ACB9R6Q7_9MYRT|nr:hypothetical protein MLD38_012728 [Melastoma candidum]
MARTLNSVVIEREDLVLPLSEGPATGTPFLRTCHFLKPCLPSSHLGPFPVPPKISPPLSYGSLDYPPDIRFRYPVGPGRGWVEWVEIMEPLHCHTWRKAGILEAIRCSTYRINRDEGLIVGLAERWCPETSSFVFPWGEASVTLEDVYVLWGYSVLPSPVLTEDDEMVETESRLKVARWDIIKSKSKKASSSRWMNTFKGRGSDIEHEAFLAFWLSRFVFPRSSHTIYEDLFLIAVQMARGNKVAIAPIVLASIYRELNLLKKYICDLAAGKLEDKSRCSDVALWAPLGILQVWVWERFVHLQPRPRIIRPGEPRLSRWDNVRCSEFKDIRAVLDRIDTDDHFEWRPYAKEVENFEVPIFYGQHGRWVRLGGGNSKDEEEMLFFTRFLVPCELVGLESTEHYLPHRVAMQFGMDQDIPGCFSPYDKSAEVAWKSDNSSFQDMWLYLPPRGSTQYLTKRYDYWHRSRPKDVPVKRSMEVADGSESSIPRDFSPSPGYAIVDESGDESDDDNLSLREFWSKIERRHDFQGSSKVPERPMKLQRLVQSASRNQSSLPPGFMATSTRNKCLSESSDDDHTIPGEIHFGQQKSMDADPSGTPFKSYMDSTSPPESPSWRDIVILSESEESSEEHEPIQENTSSVRTSEQKSAAAASLWRNQMVFAVDILEQGMTARISKLETDVTALKLPKTKGGLLPSAVL